jgi:hypothetical protein
MVVVRYATLLALVVWLGVMQCMLFSDRPDYADWLPFVCGGLMTIGLFAMKFVGPPPRAFVPRAGIVFLMLCNAGADWFYGFSVAPVVNTALGLLLLAWYARE